MASEESGSAARRYVGRLVTYRNGDMTLFVPFVVDDHRTTITETSNNNESADENDSRVVVLVNPSNRTYSVIQAFPDMDALFADLQKAAGPPPASKASIDALPEVENEDDDATDCAICLDGMKVAKVMPCKHMFHGRCVVKWLKIHGSCPVCRYPMPAEQKELKDDDNGSTRMRVIWVPVSVESYNNLSSNQDTE